MRESTCVLSTPEKRNPRSERSTRKRVRSGIGPSTASGIESEARLAGPDAERPSSLTFRTENCMGATNIPPTTEVNFESYSSATLNPVRATPLPLLIEVGWLFVHKFPEFAFIHTPTFFQTVRDEVFDQLKVCAMLALCAKFIPELITRHGSAAQAGKFYADFVRLELNAKISRGADVETIQCLLLIGMYEWGEGAGFNAWMYIGKQGNPSRLETECLILR